MDGLKQSLLAEHGDGGHGSQPDTQGHSHDCGHSHDGGHSHEGGHGHEGGHTQGGHSHEEGHSHGHEDCGHAHEEHGHSHGLSHAAHDEGHGHGHGHGLCHGHGHEHGGMQEDKRRMQQAIYFALFFMMVEIVGGIEANSLAIITDAAHMLSDVGGLVVSLLVLQLAEMEATAEFSYGFRQAEVLGAMLCVMLVWGLAAVLFYEAVCRFMQPEEVDAPIMLAIAAIGFVVNIVLMLVLGHGHDHDHDHHHGHGGEAHGAAMQAMIAHVIGDLLQSLSVCFAAGLMWWRPFDIGLTSGGLNRWCYADPCCTVVFSVLVLYTTKSTTLRVVNTLMAKAPKHINRADFEQKLQAIANVHDVHDLHLWLFGSEVLCTAHVMVTAPKHATEVLKSCIRVAQGTGIGHSTFQIEIAGEFDPAEEHYGALHKNPSRRDIEDGGSPRSSPHGHAGHQGGHVGGHGHAH